MLSAERDRLILERRSQVEAIAGQIARRLPVCVELDDLVSAGMVGLLQALDTYDPARGAPMGAWLNQRIRGAILDSLRKLDSLPRGVRRHAKRSEAAVIALGHRLMRTPTAAEIASELGMDVAEFHRRSCAAAAAVVYRAADDDGAAVDPIDLAPRPEAIAMDNEVLPVVCAALKQLRPRQRRVLVLVYYYGMSQSQIARGWGVHESLVSQICRAAMKQCRKVLASSGVCSSSDVLPGHRPRKGLCL